MYTYLYVYRFAAFGDDGDGFGTAFDDPGQQVPLSILIYIYICIYISINPYLSVSIYLSIYI